MKIPNIIIGGEFDPVFKKSTRKNKKYMVLTPNKKWVHFGDKRFSQYKDTTTLRIYSNLDHLDKKRRDRYRARASKIKNKKGEYTYKNPEYPNYYAYNFLW